MQKPRKRPEVSQQSTKLPIPMLVSTGAHFISVAFNGSFLRASYSKDPCDHVKGRVKIYQRLLTWLLRVST